MMRVRLNYLIIPIVVFLTAYFGGWLTEQGMTWYKTLALPNFTPLGSTIGIVWTIIFILSMLSALIVWNRKRHINFSVIVFLFIINALLNITWSYLFFYLGLIASAFWGAVFLDITIIALIVLIWPISRLAAVLLIPYAGWVAFASYLNYSIWLLNK